jgi:hypothetical protein
MAQNSLLCVMPSLVKITGKPKPYCLKIGMTMKTLTSFFGFLLVLVSISVYAQEYPEYISAPELEAYVGTWKWESGDSVVIVHFEIVKKIYVREFWGSVDDEMGSIKSDFLLGWHKVIKGNSVTQNSIAEKDDKNNRLRNNTIKNMHDSNSNILRNSSFKGVYEKNFNRVGVVKFTDLNNNTNPAVGHIKLLDENTMSIELSMEPEGLYIAAERAKKHKPKYQLPLKMVLKRVE